MDKEVLKRRMTERFQQRLEQAIGAVEQAPDGQVIAATGRRRVRCMRVRCMRVSTG
jgi:primosomal protein N''